MTTAPVRGRQLLSAGVGRVRPRAGVPAVVLVVAAVTVLLRLRYVASPMSPDEGGFLAVARQWSPGPSLYGHYWVDRPPLLLALFRLADLAGGLPALRVLGCVASAVTVIAVAVAVHRVAGRAAAGWAAATAGALLVSPLVGAVAVNGELLAAPFVASGIALAVLAVDERHHHRAALLAAGVGACGTAAVLVKQNMLDVAVFAVVLVLAALRRRQLARSAAGALAVASSGGAIATGLLVLGGAALAGTRPGGVLFAMYDFRLRATAVMRAVDPSGRWQHLQALGGRELAAAGVLPVLALVVLVVRRRRTAGTSLLPAVGLATLAVAGFDVVSVLLGGSYWGHYLVQLTVPTALAAGLVVGRRPRLDWLLVVPVLVSAVLAWTLGQGARVHDPGVRIGTAIAASSAPGDTLVTVLGDADMVASSGLTSPYPYLWSLPARTLDRRLTGLASVLRGPRPPTWVVLRGPTTQGFVDRTSAGVALRAAYHLVGETCGRRVFLLNGAERAVPAVTGPCTETLTGSPDPQTRRSTR